MISVSNNLHSVAGKASAEALDVGLGREDENLVLERLLRQRSTLHSYFDEKYKAVWLSMRHERTVCWTPELLSELNGFYDELMDFYQAKDAEDQPIQFLVGCSLRPGVFNMGGDLLHFLECVRSGNVEALRAYAYACVETIYKSYIGFNSPVVSIVVLEGDTLGGGLEAALTNQVIIAEKGISLGFPEANFQTFPGMGAFSILSRRLGGAQAEKVIMNKKMSSSDRYFELGLVDILVEKGEGRAAAQSFIEENSNRHSLLAALGKVRRRVAPLTFEELRDVTDVWVEAVMRLSPLNLRRMEMLASSQGRLVSSVSAPVDTSGT